MRSRLEPVEHPGVPATQEHAVNVEKQKWQIAGAIFHPIDVRRIRISLRIPMMSLGHSEMMSLGVPR